MAKVVNFSVYSESSASVYTRKFTSLHVHFTTHSNNYITLTTSIIIIIIIIISYLFLAYYISKISMLNTKLVTI